MCRSVEGLSIEFQMLNLLGFACYSAYNVALFCIPAVQHEYTAAYSQNIPVGPEDVAFSVHAAIITLATLIQCMVYDRGGQRFFSPVDTFAVVAGALVLAACPVVAIAEGQSQKGLLTWLNLLLLLSLIKLAVSLVKYIPQVCLSYVPAPLSLAQSQ
jgi:cystinosin